MAYETGRGSEQTQAILPAAWRDWSVTRCLGEGAYAKVYEVERGAQRSAVKVIALSDEEENRAKLLAESTDRETVHLYLHDLAGQYTKEIELMDALRAEPNIVRIEDHLVEWDTEGDAETLRIYIRMELLETLQEHFSRTPVTEGEVIRLGMDLCSALRVCEKHHILHRDIKPGNVFHDADGAFKLGDFGSARTADLSGAAYTVKGTFSFMAPETFRGEPYDNRVDLYSLGILMYRLMNRNRDPFVDPYKKLVVYREREEALQRRMAGEALPHPADASEKLTAVLLKACAFAPAQRYADAQAMCADLARAADPSVPPEDMEAQLSEDRGAQTPESREAQPPGSSETQRPEEGADVIERGESSMRSRPGRFRNILLAVGLVGAAALALHTAGSRSRVRQEAPALTEAEEAAAVTAVPEEAQGLVALREDPPARSEKMEAALAGAEEFLMRLASLAMQDRQAFSACFLDTEESIIDDYYRDLRGFAASYPARVVVPIGEMDDVCLVNVVGNRDTDQTREEGAEWSQGWVLFLKETEDGWKICMEDAVVEDFAAYMLEGAYPAGLAENFAQDRYNSIMVDQNNYFYLDAGAVYPDLCTVQVRFLWQDAEGDVLVSVLFANGQETPYTFADLTLQLNDRQLGTVLRGSLPGTVTVQPGTNELRTYRFAAQQVLTGTAQWQDVTPALTFAD